MKTNHSKLSSLLFNTDDTKKCLWHFSSPSFMRDYKDICSSGICSSVVLWVRIPKRKNPRNTIWSKDDIPGMTWITFSIYGTHSMFNSPIVSTWVETMAWMSIVHGNKSYLCVWGNISGLCITLHPGIGSGYSSFYGQLQSSLFFHEKRDINAPRSISLSS